MSYEIGSGGPVTEEEWAQQAAEGIERGKRRVIERASLRLVHLCQADEILAQHLGPKHPVRLGIEELREGIYRDLQQFSHKG